MAINKNKRNLRNKLAKTLVSLFVLAVFITPGLLTIRWVLSQALPKNPGHVGSAQAKQTPSVADKVNLPIKAQNQTDNLVGKAGN